MAQIPALRLKSQPQSSNPSRETEIPASRFKFQPQSSNPSLEAQIPASRLKSQPPGSNPSIEAQFPFSRPKSQPRGTNPSLEAQIPGHRPLWGRYPSYCNHYHYRQLQRGNGSKAYKTTHWGKRSLTHSPHAPHSALFPCTPFCSAALRSVHCAPLQSSPLRTAPLGHLVVSEKVAMN